ncbi:MAG: glutamine--tRNA ligase/YqeY domain fusion protein [Proteobacteria bacterium]|nr:glutamine--tRNA ligase/YqeY domain fusion protein [Pseudomonadota bacterium]
MASTSAPGSSCCGSPTDRRSDVGPVATTRRSRTDLGVQSGRHGRAQRLHSRHHRRGSPDRQAHARRDAVPSRAQRLPPHRAPEKEEVEYVQSIEHDVRWLGFEPSAVLFSADYFPRMYELAEKLVQDGKAYVCDLTNEAVREHRGTLLEPGTPSPYRARSVAENLDLLHRMMAGEFPDGARTLRALGDMASANMKMRDPHLYRIRHAHHHRTGDQWCIYPMYDYAHPLEDAIEGITHSICTLEFENNRELYDWVIEHTEVSKGTVAPRQYEFARLALEYTVMSKRKLLELVKQGHVSGWDDPRMPTISGMRRRGFAAEAIRAFCDMIGVAKANSFVDIGKLEYCVREELNRNAPRVLGVIDPIEVELVDAPAAITIDAPGPRTLAIGARVYVDRDDWRDEAPDDYQRLAPGRTVRLRYAYCITVGTDPADVTRDASGKVTKLRATVHPETLGGKNLASGARPAGVIHWVDVATAIDAEVRIYDRLFKSARPEEGGGDFFAQIDPGSLQIVTTAKLEASLATAAVGARFQLERVGYFIVDADTTPTRRVLARIVTLRDSYHAHAAVEVEPAVVEKKQNKKAATRPKSKSPQEYRAEARVRDSELAAAYDHIAALVGPDHADLLTDSLTLASLFRAAEAHAELAAKWLINELPRALGERELEPTTLSADHFAAFVDAVARQTLHATAAKAVLAAMVATGKPHDQVAVAPAAPVDLDAAIASVITAHADKVAQYRGGKTGLLGFLVGQVMKAAPGADAAAVNAAMRDRLAT